MATLQLLGLPNELLVIILSNLPARSIFACMVSCRRLLAIRKRSRLLERIIWSTKHGIHELLPPGLSIPHFHTIAQKWENGWINFKVGNQAATRSMYGPSQGLLGLEWYSATECNFLLRSGHLIRMCRNENPGWSHMDLSLQHKLRGFMSAPEWTNVRLGAHVKMKGWALDLDQDLVAALLQT
jgi:hypothetical protein